MVQFFLKKLKDLGLQREVSEALPYAVVGGAWEGSFTNPYDKYVALTHIVPAGHQLKILFLRVWTQETTGAKFSIEQTRPGEGEPGHPAVGSSVYDTDSPPGTGVRDYPMLEAAGAEVLHGSLKDPIHVLEGKVTFNVLYTPTPPTEKRYGIVWWGVEKISE